MFPFKSPGDFLYAMPLHVMNFRPSPYTHTTAHSQIAVYNVRHLLHYITSTGVYQDEDHGMAIHALGSSPRPFSPPLLLLWPTITFKPILLSSFLDLFLAFYKSLSLHTKHDENRKTQNQALTTRQLQDHSFLFNIIYKTFKTPPSSMLSCCQTLYTRLNPKIQRQSILNIPAIANTVYIFCGYRLHHIRMYAESSRHTEGPWYVRGTTVPSYGPCKLQTVMASTPTQADERQPDDEDKSIAEDCRRLRRLQSFRKKNACALMALACPSPGLSSCAAQEALTDGYGTRSGFVSAHHSQDRTTSSPLSEPCTVVVPYRLTHFICSLTPTVSCSRLDHTRPGHPSDVPPLVRIRQEGRPRVNVHVNEQDVTLNTRNNMLSRLIIPNSNATSIRAEDSLRRRDIMLMVERTRGAKVGLPGSARRRRHGRKY